MIETVYGSFHLMSFPSQCNVQFAPAISQDSNVMIYDLLTSIPDLTCLFALLSCSCRRHISSSLALALKCFAIIVIILYVITTFVPSLVLFMRCFVADLIKAATKR
ncbi:hypothetical protein L208DRAFT_911563 [Tricholoma matsutake]|nr:hypothetical protein L208DRAFT_911563 [Tricholoma matsutake 945]